MVSLALVLLVIGAAVAAVLSLNRLVAANRGLIVAQIERAVGRRVQVDAIEATLWGRPGVRLTDVRVAEDPQFGAGAVVTAAAVTVRVKLWPLLRRRFEVARVGLTRPHLRVVRLANGRLNLDTLWRATATASQGPPAVIPVAADQPRPGAGVAVLIAVVDVDDGTVEIVDRSAAPSRTTTLRHLFVRASDVALDRPVRVRLRCALNGDEENVRLDGRFGPLSSPAAVPISMGGAIGPVGERAFRVDALAVQAQWRGDSLHVTSAEGKAFGGRIRLNGTVPVPLRERGAVRVQAEGVDVEVAHAMGLASAEAAGEIEGRAHIVLDLSGRGRDWPALRESLAGSAVLDVADGALLNFNLVAEVLKRIARLPGLAGMVSERLGPPYREVVSRRDTRFESLHASAQIRDGRIRSDDVTIVAQDYSVRAAGWIGFTRQADVRGRLALSQPLSAEMAGDLKAVEHFFDQERRVSIPFVFRGEVGRARPQADLEELGPVLGRIVGGGFGRLLEGIVGGRERQEATPEPRDAPAEDLLRRGLRDLLGR